MEIGTFYLQATRDTVIMNKERLGITLIMEKAKNISQEILI